MLKEPLARMVKKESPVIEGSKGMYFVQSFFELFEIMLSYLSNTLSFVRKNYLKAMELMGTDLSDTVFIGDQLFTDVYGAKRTGMANILVKPIHPKEEIQIILKHGTGSLRGHRRCGEKIPGCKTGM